MLTSGKVNKTPKTRHFFPSKTPSECLKIQSKILWKMLTTFVDNQHFVPILEKVIPILTRMPQIYIADIHRLTIITTISVDTHTTSIFSIFRWPSEWREVPLHLKATRNTKSEGIVQKIEKK